MNPEPSKQQQQQPLLAPQPTYYQTQPQMMQGQPVVYAGQQTGTCDTPKPAVGFACNLRVQSLWANRM
jgi:hypothetical protein